jgi:tryptophan-rich sensory protein
MASSRRRWRPVLAAAPFALLAAILGGAETTLGPWYYSLQMPAWKPPDWLFAPAWTLIFALAALAAGEAWNGAARRPAARLPIVLLFAVNAALEVLWSLLFFRLQRPDWALIEVGFFWLSILALILFLAPLAARASGLLVPYLVWVSFAALLNWAVVRLNAPFPGL